MYLVLASGIAAPNARCDEARFPSFGGMLKAYRSSNEGGKGEFGFESADSVFLSRTMGLRALGPRT